MAGIGFRLRQLGREDNLLAPVASIGHAAVVSCGPWLFTIVALALINAVAAGSVSPSAVGSFRLLIIYACALSLVATAPIVMVATRLVGDAIYAGRYAQVSALFFAALLVSQAAVVVLALAVFGGLMGLPLGTVLAGTSCSAIVGAVWTGLAFCGAVRDYQGITLGFLLGLGIAVAGASLAAVSGASPLLMVWAFDAGLCVTVSVLVSRILTTFPDGISEIVEPVLDLARGMKELWQLGLGAAVAAIAIWIDKWVIWLGPIGERHEIGLVHAPLYDSAMFVAYLSIIPALALFVTHVETEFFDSYREYYDAIRSHGSLRKIEERAASLDQTTVKSLINIVVVQATVCAIFAIGAPSIVEVSGLHYQQVGILRLGAIGALFQFIFVASTSLLLFFERHSQFLLLQLLYLALQAGLARLSVELGTTYYGLGYLVASVLAAWLAIGVLTHTLRNLTFLTFASAARQAKAAWQR